MSIRDQITKSVAAVRGKLRGVVARVTAPPAKPSRYPPPEDGEDSMPEDDGARAVTYDTVEEFTEALRRRLQNRD